MQDYNVTLNKQRRSFRLRPFEELWNIKVVNTGACQATLNIVAFKLDDPQAHLVLCTTVAVGTFMQPDPGIWASLVNYQTQAYIIEFALLEADAEVRLELVLGN